MTIDFTRFASLKGEFEAEGLTQVLLRRRARESERTLPAVNSRLAALTKRV